MTRYRISLEQAHYAASTINLRLAAVLATVTVEELQRREEHWVFADLIGKGGHIRTVPVPSWVGSAIQAAGYFIDDEERIRSTYGNTFPLNRRLLGRLHVVP